jgi:hypothetical protein
MAHVTRSLRGVAGPVLAAAATTLVTVTGDLVVFLYVTLAAGAGHDPGQAFNALISSLALLGSMAVLAIPVTLCAGPALRGWRSAYLGGRARPGARQPSAGSLFVGALASCVAVALLAAPNVVKAWRYREHYASAPASDLFGLFSFLVGAALAGGVLFGALGTVAGVLVSLVFDAVLSEIERKREAADGR